MTKHLAQKAILDRALTTLKPPLFYFVGDEMTAELLAEGVVTDRIRLQAQEALRDIYGPTRKKAAV